MVEGQCHVSDDAGHRVDVTDTLKWEADEMMLDARELHLEVGSSGIHLSEGSLRVCAESIDFISE